MNNIFTSVPALFGASVDSTDTASCLKAAIPPIACSSLTNDVSGCVVFVWRGTCSYTVKTRVVQEANGVAIVIANSVLSPPLIIMEAPSGLSSASLSIAAVFVSKIDGTTMDSILQNSSLSDVQARLVQKSAVVEEKNALVELYKETGGDSSWSSVVSQGWQLNEDPCLGQRWPGISCSLNGHIVGVLLVSVGLRNTLPLQDLLVLTSLIELSLTNNPLLSGALPNIAGFEALTILELSGCSFSGTVPASWYSATALTRIRMSRNRVSGTLSVRNFAKLSELSLSSNLLSGTLPSVLPSTLKTLNVDENRFSSLVPSALWNSSSPLQTLSLASNALELPTTLESPSKILRKLSLSFQNFSSPIPPYIGEFTALEELRLDHCDFVNPIPSSFVNLTSLLTLDLSFNRFSGALPKLIQDMTALTTLIVNDNQFTQIPRVFPAGLVMVDLSNNVVATSGALLVESLPATIEVVRVSSNQLTNSLYFDAFFYVHLRELHAGSNLLTEFGVDRLSSTVTIVDFSSNLLSGTIEYFSSLPQLQTLLLANNSRLHYGGGQLLPSFLSYSFADGVQVVDHVHMHCPNIIGANRKTVVSLDPQYYDYILCRCEAGYVRVGNECVPCLEHALCPGGENDKVMVARRGYYATPPDDFPQKMLKCQLVDVDQTACNANNDIVFKCSDGYSDRLCSRCESSYYRDGNSCASCKGASSSLSVVYLVVVLLALTVYLTVLHQHHRKVSSYSIYDRRATVTPNSPPMASTNIMSRLERSLSDPTAIRHMMPQAGTFHVKKAVRVWRTSMFVDRSALNASFLVIANYLQTISLVFNYYSLPSSVSFLREIFHPFQLQFSNGGGIQCLIADTTYQRQLEILFVYLPLILFGIVVTLCLMGCFYVLYETKRESSDREDALWRLHGRAASSILLLLHFMYFPLTVASLSVLQWSKDPVTNEVYLANQPYIRRSNVSVALMVCPVVFYVIGIPLLFVSWYATQRGRLLEEPTVRKWGWFYLHFSEGNFWCGFVFLARKLLFSVCIALIPYDYGTRTMSLLLIQFSSVVFFTLRRPFSAFLDNSLEIMASSCSCLLLMVVSLISGQREPSSAFEVNVPDLLVFEVLIWILTWGFCMFAVLLAVRKQLLQWITPVSSTSHPKEPSSTKEPKSTASTPMNMRIQSEIRPRERPRRQSTPQLGTIVVAPSVSTLRQLSNIDEILSRSASIENSSVKGDVGVELVTSSSEPVRRERPRREFVYNTADTNADTVDTNTGRPYVGRDPAQPPSCSVC